jgi:Putative Actinobacterial Holin-X, holin superfamily III
MRSMLPTRLPGAPPLIVLAAQRARRLLPVGFGHEGGTMSETPAVRRRSETPSREDPTLGKLVADASRDVSSLVRNEIALAKSELKISVKAGGLGLGLFGAAAFLGLLAVIMLSVAIAYFISFTGLDLAWCFLIVFVLYIALAGLLGFVGLRKIKQVRAPERAIHQAQETKNILSRG